MKSYFKSIQLKLILSFLVPVLFIILLGTVSYQKAAKGIRDSYEQSSGQTINMTREYLQLGIDNVEALSTQYQNDDSIKKHFIGTDKDNLVKYSSNIKAITNSIIAKETADDFISDIYLLSDKFNSISTATLSGSGIVEGFNKTERGKSLNSTFLMFWVGSETYLDEQIGTRPGDYSLRLIRRAVGSDALIIIDLDYKKVNNILQNVLLVDSEIIGFVTGDGKEILCGNVDDNENMIFTEQEFYKDALASKEISDSYYVNYQGESHLFMYSKVGNTGSMICALMPRDIILSQADSIRNLSIVIVLIACATAVMIGLYISNGIGRTINYIISKLKRVSDGDLTVHLETKRGDEFLILIDKMNGTFHNMKELVGEAKNLSKDVADASINLSSTSGAFVKTSGDIAHAMNEIETGVMQQAKDAEECLMQMDHLSDKIVMLGEDTSKIGKIAESTKINIQDGTIATSNLNEQTQTTKEITSAIVTEIQNLAEKSKLIDSIVNVINTLSNQTNLLSLNASIEAARAGEAGKGFAVVADEIRNLADQTSKSVYDIRNIIKIIREGTTSAVQTVKKAEDIMILQEEAVMNTTDSYQSINNSVDNLMKHLGKIINNVSDIDEARISILGAIENISAVLEEVAASTNHVNQTSTDQLKAIETLNQWAENLNKYSDNLMGTVQRFHV